MLVYKPKHHLNQDTGLNYLTNFEMIHLKFSLTINVTKQKFAYRVHERKKLTGL